MYPTADPFVTQEFGVKGTYWQAGYHTGRDYRASTGTSIKATFRGQVKTVGNASSYGLYVVVLTETPSLVAVRHYYCHLSSITVKDEHWVNPGQEIGKAGDTGNATAAHLHYEERVSPFGYYDHRQPILDRIPWKVVDLSKIQESFKREPNTSLTLYPENTKVMQQALRHEGLYAGTALDGHVSVRMQDGYKQFESEQGWVPTGIPSSEGVRRLGVRWGHGVTA